MNRLRRLFNPQTVEDVVVVCAVAWAATLCIICAVAWWPA